MGPIMIGGLGDLGTSAHDLRKLAAAYLISSSSFCFSRAAYFALSLSSRIFFSILSFTI